MIRRFLDRLYGTAEVLGAIAFVAILLPIAGQVAARPFNAVVPAADEFAGYAMAASLFLMLGPALRRGAHIRVGVVLDRLRPAARRPLEIACLAFGTALAGFFAIAWVRMTWDSYDFGDLSQGVLPVPLWLPQAVMGVGLVVLVVALADDLVSVLMGRPASYDSAPAASEG